MKELLLEITLTIIAFILFFGMIWLAEFLASVISINTIINTCYVAIVLGFIYLIKD